MDEIDGLHVFLGGVVLALVIVTIVAVAQCGVERGYHDAHRALHRQEAR